MFWGIGEVSKSRLPNKNSDPPILVKVLGKKKTGEKGQLWFRWQKSSSSGPFSCCAPVNPEEKGEQTDLHTHNPQI